MRGVSRAALLAAGLGEEETVALLDAVRRFPTGEPPERVWSRLSRSVLEPAVPFPAHLLLHRAVFRNWDSSQGPPPAWIPTPEEIRDSNLRRFCAAYGIDPIESLHSWSVRDRERFWACVIDALGIPFRTPPARILDPGGGAESARWLPGARLNIADACFRAGPGETAVVFQAEEGPAGRLTYAELDRLSNRVANSLPGIGIHRGDAFAIAMPMTAEAVAAYLGIVKAGCAVISIADSFAADEITIRLRIGRARAVLTQDVIRRAGKSLPMYAKVVEAGAETAIVIPAGGRLETPLRPADREWTRFLAAEERFDPVECGPDEVINVLFSSGTTGDPKAIPWTHATPIKCAMDALLHHDLRPGEAVVWPTNLGWMMGPWLIFATLINRATVGLYYGAPNTPGFCRFVQDAGVRMLGVVPSLVQAWRGGGMVEGLDWSRIRLFSSTGEASNPEDMLWLMARARYRPVIEYCGGTEIGGGYITGSVARPASPATFSTPAFGLDLHILDEDGRPAENGELFLVPPSIGLSTSLLNRDHHEAYHAGTPRGPAGEILRRHGDQMERLPGGFFRAHGRADDTMNLGGIKVSSAEIERTVSRVEGVRETAAVAWDPPGGGPSRLVIYAVPAAGRRPDREGLKRSMQEAIRSRLNPLFRVHDVVVVDELPRTASN
ncbi:MAG: AMP-binding protein, partial [Acidobacteria bacterium]|nr:AMP-binding protein [Acidobacteriota bacterium]